MLILTESVEQFIFYEQRDVVSLIKYMRIKSIIFK